MARIRGRRLSRERAMVSTLLRDPDRRLWLGAAAMAGGAGLAATAVPFVASLAPSERSRAEAGPVDVDLQRLREGELNTVEWRGRPVFVFLRSPAVLEALTRHDGLLADPLSRRSDQPAYARNVHRSAKPAVAVLEGLCTHLGCIPTLRPQPGSPDLGASWPGGFFCPCHGSKFDFAGRVFRNVPAPTNLAVPPHRFVGDTVLRIGADAQD
jgi:ubiquinol-cytochrome c reductase iron-sulfur subunit